MLPLPIPPSGTPWEADGLQRSFVNGSIGAFRPCDASSRTYDHSLRPRLIILIASMKVTLNSLRMFAWLLSRLRHACSGGAPPSKSNSCSAVRPTYSSAGHEFFRQWKMWPLTIAPARLEVLVAASHPPPRPRSLPQPHRHDPARAARRRSGVRAPWAPAKPEDSRAGRPHAHPPRRPGSPAVALRIAAPPPQIDSAPSGSAGHAAAGWIGLDRIQPVSMYGSPCPSSSTFSPRGLSVAALVWCDMESFSRSEKVRGSRRRTHWCPEGGGLGLQPRYARMSWGGGRFTSVFSDGSSWSLR